jgi:hypothetical protein
MLILGHRLKIIHVFLSVWLVYLRISTVRSAVRRIDCIKMYMMFKIAADNRVCWCIVWFFEYLLLNLRVSSKQLCTDSDEIRPVVGSSRVAVQARAFNWFQWTVVGVAWSLADRPAYDIPAAAEVRPTLQ